MNIALIVPSLKQAGPVNVAYDLARLFVGNNHDVTVLYFDKVKEGVHKFPCETVCLRDHEIDLDKFDIVHTHGQRPAKYVYQNKKACRHAKFVSTAHNYVFEDYSAKYGILKGYIGGYLYLRYLKSHDKIITLSADARQYYKRFLKSSNIEYIYNSRIIEDGKIISELTKSILEFKENSVLIGTNASLIKRKGLDILIKALSVLPENYKLIIAGEGPEHESLLKLGAELNVKDRIKFLGFVKNAHLLMPFYDIFCLPSNSEGFPLGLLEAASHGIPSIVSDLPVLLEAFNAEELVFFKKGNPNDLALNIENLWNQRKNYGVNLKKAYKDRFSPEYFYKSHMDLYTSLIKIN